MAGVRARLLIVGASHQPTGFGRITAELCTGLSDDFEILLFSIRSRVAPSEDGFTVRENQLPGDPFGRRQLPALLDQFQPDIVLLYQDRPFANVHARAIAAYRATGRQVRVVAYVPIDTDELPAAAAESFPSLDMLVLFAPFARDVVERCHRDHGIAPPELQVVPHGLDTAAFRPLVPGDAAASRAISRTTLFPGRPDLRDAFIVLNANRNTPRKRIDLTMEAFAAFSRRRPDTWLYLHMGMRDIGYDIRGLARSLGIEHRLLTTTDADAPPNVDDARLNLIYNACDVGVNTCTGEGWGLVAFEHAATGAAQILPDHTACADLWRHAAEFVPVRRENWAQRLVQPSDVASGMARLYESRARRSDREQAAFGVTCRIEYSWHAVIEHWQRILGSTAISAVTATPAVRARPRVQVDARRPATRGSCQSAPGQFEELEVWTNGYSR